MTHYLLFGAPADQFTAVEEQEILEGRGAPHFLERLREARTAGRLGYLLGLLQGAPAPESLPALECFISALADFADDLRISEGTIDTEWGYLQSVQSIVWKIVRDLPENERVRLLTGVFARMNGLWFSLAFAEGLKDQLPADLRQQLIEKTSEKLRLAERDRLTTISAIREVLQWWSNHGGEEQAIEIAAEMLEDDVKIFNLLESFSYDYMANIGKRRKRRLRRRAHLDALIEYVPLDRLAERLSSVKANKLSRQQRVLVTAFEHAIALKRGGQSESD